MDSRLYQCKSNQLLVTSSLTDVYQCTFTVIEDPGIPIIHILLMGNNDDKPDDGDYQLNWNEDQVKLECEIKNWMDVPKEDRQG